MKHITKKTHYWLFKKTNEQDSECKYYFIRTITEGLDKVVWFMGYENSFGLVSSIGGELNEDKQIELEKEFQKENN